MPDKLSSDLLSLLVYRLYWIRKDNKPMLIKTYQNKDMAESDLLFKYKPEYPKRNFEIWPEWK